MQKPTRFLEFMRCQRVTTATAAQASATPVPRFKFRTAFWLFEEAAGASSRDWAPTLFHLLGHPPCLDTYVLRCSG